LCTHGQESSRTPQDKLIATVSHYCERCIQYMNNRRKAKDWIFPRHKEFETELRISSSERFKKNGFKVHSKMPYCLDKLDNWKNIPDNIDMHDYDFSMIIASKL